MPIIEVASLEFDTGNGQYPNLIHISGNVYAIAYAGPDYDGWLKTVSISNDGLTLSEIASLEFDTGNGTYIDFIHISGNVYAIAYEGPDVDGWLKTVSISNDGLTLSVIASLEFDTGTGRGSSIIHISGNTYAIAYQGPGDDGWLKTVSISNDGLTLSEIASLEFDTIHGISPFMLSIRSNVAVIAYRGPSTNMGSLKTVSISNDGLTLSEIASLLEFDSSYRTFYIIHISGNVYAIAYQGRDADGFLKTLSISDDGATLSVIESLEFDTFGCQSPYIIHISGNVYAIAYGLTSPDYDGWLKTVSISPLATPRSFGSIIG